MARIELKDVAQSVQAFLGEPGEAKDKPKEVATAYPAGAYEKVFWQGVTAAQLALPSEIYVRVNKKWRERDKEDESEQRLNEARLHLVWLIGKLLMRCISEGDPYASLGIETIRRANRRIDRWFPVAYDIAKDAVEDVIDLSDDQLSSGALSLRQLFRSSNYYNRFERRLDRASRREFDGLKNLVL